MTCIADTVARSLVTVQVIVQPVAPKWRFARRPSRVPRIARVDLSSEILFFSKLRARFLQVTGDVQYQSGRSQTLKYHIISHDNIM